MDIVFVELGYLALFMHGSLERLSPGNLLSDRQTNIEYWFLERKCVGLYSPQFQGNFRVNIRLSIIEHVKSKT